MNLHFYQLTILHKLMYNPRLKFSDLQIESLTSKHFNYHLQQLKELKLIEKSDFGYVLTDVGKNFVSKLDETTMQEEVQPKISVALIVTRDNGSEREFLVTKRLKQPYYGKVGGFTGKIRFGETFVQAAKRELLEETGLTGKFKLAHVHHKLAYEKDPQKFFQDNIFVIFHVTDPEGKLITRNNEQENFWIAESELFKRQDLFNTFPHIVKYALTADQKVSEGKIKEIGY